MSSYDLLFTPIALLGVAAQFALPVTLAVLVVVLLRRGHPDAGTSAVVLAARRHAAWTTVIAVVLALLVAPMTVLLVRFALAEPMSLLGSGTPRRYDSQGDAMSDLLTARHLSLVVTISGIVYVLTHLVGNLTWPRPRGRIRTAALRSRAIGDVASRAPRLAMWAWVALIAVVAAFVPLGRNDGTILRIRTGGPRGTSISTASASPYPTWSHALILLGAALVLAVLTEFVLRRTVRRPTIAGCSPADDLFLRRISASRLMRGAQLTLALVAASTLAMTGLALRSVDHTWLAMTVLTVAVVVPVIALAIVFVPTRHAEDQPDEVGSLAVRAPRAEAAGNRRDLESPTFPATPPET